MSTVADILTSVGYRLFPDSGQSITTTSEPRTEECIRWINEICEELLTLCVETRSEIGRTAAIITLVDGTSEYTDLQNLLLAPVVWHDRDGFEFSGWIEKTNCRNPLILRGGGERLDAYDNRPEGEPIEFYITGTNTISFVPTPDATYTAEIPYYAYHTALSTTTDTVPFMKIFDNVIIESVTMRAQNREEYDMSFELKWFSYVRSQARKMIHMRKNEIVRFLL